jgi:hypothetical protein
MPRCNTVNAPLVGAKNCRYGLCDGRLEFIPRFADRRLAFRLDGGRFVVRQHYDTPRRSHGLRHQGSSVDTEPLSARAPDHPKLFPDQMEGPAYCDSRNEPQEAYDAADHVDPAIYLE